MGRSLDMWPLVGCSAEMRLPADEPKLFRMLAQMTKEDAAFAFTTDQETRQILLEGAHDRHLQAKLNILLQAFSDRIQIGLIQVAYRETIVDATEVAFTHKRLFGPESEFAGIMIACEPIETRLDFQFLSTATGRFRQNSSKRSATQSCNTRTQVRFWAFR